MGIAEDLVFNKGSWDSGYGEGDASFGVAMDEGKMRSSRFMASEGGGALLGLFLEETSLDLRSSAIPDCWAAVGF